jgi:protein-tyrosine phosphatase
MIVNTVRSGERRLVPGMREIRARFGTHRGLVRLALSHLDSASGRLAYAKAVDWGRVERLVFVCAGNICRSAYADRKAAAMGLPTASFGLSACTGQPANEVAARVAAHRGVDLGPHRSMAAGDFIGRPSDLQLAMEPRQGAAMRPGFTAAAGQLTLLGLWARPPRPHIHDPYSLDEAYFETCFDVIDSALGSIAERLCR